MELRFPAGLGTATGSPRSGAEELVVVVTCAKTAKFSVEVEFFFFFFVSVGGRRGRERERAAVVNFAHRCDFLV